MWRFKCICDLVANHLYINKRRKIITMRLWLRKNGEKRRSVDSPQPLKLRAKFFVVPWKNPFSLQNKNYHIRKTILIFFLLLLSQTVIIFQLISFNYSSRSMAYLFPLKTQINIKIERIIVLIKPTSDNTLLIFLISFLWSRFLENWKLNFETF